MRLFPPEVSWIKINYNVRDGRVTPEALLGDDEVGR